MHRTLMTSASNWRISGKVVAEHYRREAVLRRVEAKFHGQCRADRLSAARRRLCGKRERAGSPDGSGLCRVTQACPVRWCGTTQLIGKQGLEQTGEAPRAPRPKTLDQRGMVAIQLRLVAVNRFDSKFRNEDQHAALVA